MLLIQFVVAFFATAAFSVIFNIPKNQWFFAGFTGGAGWVLYWWLSGQRGVVVATFIAVVVITLLSRIFAIVRKAPVTIFLVSGIFPLVPGVGIYYTSYYLIMNELAMAGEKGMETLKIAVAITLGIMCVLLIPQKVIAIPDIYVQRYLKKKKRR
ncbi:threonine/serine exporter family protein [Catenibacillus scindens]|uniref:threonine/serine exporter family protein n=1 Tax=Catenibacillus scindens TaxID=673271 RepID=UPI00320AA5DF